MSSAAPSFATRVAAGRRELSAIVPEIATPDLDLPASAMATIIAMSHCRLTVSRHDDAVSATFLCDPAPQSGSHGRSLLDLAEAAVAGSFAAPDNYLIVRLDRWIEQQGFLEIVTALVRAGVPASRIDAAAAHIGQHVRKLGERLRYLGATHRRAIVRRDIGQLPRDPGGSFNKVLHWALAPELAGQRTRKQTLTRRRQALDAYGAIASVFLEPEVSGAIDEGLPLNACLAARLSIGEAHLRRLRGLRPAELALTERGDHVKAIKNLVLHEVPLHQWPKDEEWASAPWSDHSNPTLLRPDYLSGSTERRDAFQALKDDLLVPLAGERATILGFAERQPVQYFVSSLSVPVALAHGEQHRVWLRALRQAVIGPRGLKSFDQASKRWHRRAATIAALRHEEQTDTPGWPALCTPWRAPDGEYSIVPLSTAEDLVVEGNALDHCVGGYYAQCRRGDTQILSLRAGEQRCATLELFLEPAADGGVSIRLGQFKAYRNSKPDRCHHEILRAFLYDLRTGRHAIFVRDIRAFRRKMARESDYVWSRGPLPLEHARRAWPLYRSLLPKGAPDTLDAWYAQTGLIYAFDSMLAAVASAAK